MTTKPTYICTTRTSDETKRAAQTLAPSLAEGDVIVLTGDLGAGKTQFVQGLAQALGITDDVISPTFNILLTYQGKQLPINHFDLYRLESSEELEDIGYFETVGASGVSCIEWGDSFPDDLPDDYLRIIIALRDDGTRTVSAQAIGSRHRQLLSEWAEAAASLPPLMRTAGDDGQQTPCASSPERCVE